MTRHDVMYNDFVIVGPASDPAGVKGMDDARAALAKIAEEQAIFASRGDDSGTHKKELSLWDAAGVDPSEASGTWYRETGSGMGATLNTGVGMGAYVMTDRATWISFGNKADHEIVVEGDKALFNQYGIIMVNPEKHPRVNAKPRRCSSTGSCRMRGRAQSRRSRSMASSFSRRMRTRARAEPPSGFRRCWAGAVEMHCAEAGDIVAAQVGGLLDEYRLAAKAQQRLKRRLEPCPP